MRELGLPTLGELRERHLGLWRERCQQHAPLVGAVAVILLTALTWSSANERRSFNATHTRSHPSIFGPNTRAHSYISAARCAA